MDEFLNDGVYYWLGLTDLAHEGHNHNSFVMFAVNMTYLFAGIFKWEEGHDQADYTNWWPGEPNNVGEKEDCVLKSLQSYESAPIDDRIGWDDFPCDKETIHEFSIHALCMIS